MKKFEFGPIQLKWLESLETHPERQLTGQLAKFVSLGIEEYRACCLGEYCIIAGVGDFSEDGDYEVGKSYALVDESWKDLGLYSSDGAFENEYRLDGYRSLASMNDNGMTWLQIAKFVRENPEKVFNKSI